MTAQRIYHHVEMSSKVDEGFFENYSSAKFGQTAKDLKLRVVNERLDHQKRTLCPASCCLCLSCADLVDPLSDKERVMKLITGFVREYSERENEFSADVYSFLMNYVGGPKEFEEDQLWSNKQRKQRAREDCYRKWCTECVCKYIKSSICCQYDIRYLLQSLCMILCGMILLSGKDVAALVINFGNECGFGSDAEMDNDFLRSIPFNVPMWMTFGSILHLLVVIIGPCICCAVMVCTDLCYCTAISIASIMGCLIWSFFTAWMVIGFLLYSHMDNEYDGYEGCKWMVLIWSIIQAFEIVLPFCGGCCWCLVMGCCYLFDDDD